MRKNWIHSNRTLDDNSCHRLLLFLCMIRRGFRDWCCRVHLNRYFSTAFFGLSLNFCQSIGTLFRWFLYGVCIYGRQTNFVPFLNNPIDRVFKTVHPFLLAFSRQFITACFHIWCHLSNSCNLQIMLHFLLISERSSNEFSVRDSKLRIKFKL